MWTLTYPENWPYGYAVENQPETLLSERRGPLRGLFMPEVDSSKLLQPRYSHVAALLP
jgi:hypothetical protein